MTMFKMKLIVLSISLGAVLTAVGGEPMGVVHASTPAPTYSYCVTGAPGSWTVTAYTAPQPGEACYDTVIAAVNSLPADVTASGSTDATTCQANLPASAPPGTVSFVRCQNSSMTVIAVKDPVASSSTRATRSTNRDSLVESRQKRLTHGFGHLVF